MNDEGLVFSNPLALSYNEGAQIGYGSESGTIILKKKDGNFIIGDGKWRKEKADSLQSLAGSSMVRGNFYRADKNL